MKYSILTFGCRANQADSCDLECRLRAEGAEAARLDAADIVFVNTCSVTATAEQAARQAIRRAHRLNPTARIVATGCYAVRAPSEVRALPVSGVLSRDAFARGRRPDSRTPGVSDLLAGPGTGGRTLHLLRVQTGCDQACSYCIVPTTRGPSRSTPIDDVLRQVDAAERAGFKEVMLTGVHLGSYGRDLSPACSLAVLIRRLAAHPSPLRFRMSAVEPMDVDDELVAALCGSDRFASHFHLPLQHASDGMLSAMKRPYTIAEYDDRLSRLRCAFPDAALGADLIAGFPGESETDFERCAEYLDRSPLTYVHVFPFSPRPGTPAETLPGRPAGVAVRDRVTRLRAIGAKLNKTFRERFVGRTLGGLTIEDGTLVLTDNYLRVRIAAGPGANLACTVGADLRVGPPRPHRGLTRNERVRVRIVADGEPMFGESTL